MNTDTGVVPFDDMKMICRSARMIDTRIVFNDSDGRTCATKIHSIAFNHRLMTVTIFHGLGFTTIHSMDELDEIKVIPENGEEATSLRAMFDLYDICW